MQCTELGLGSIGIVKSALPRGHATYKRSFVLCGTAEHAVIKTALVRCCEYLYIRSLGAYCARLWFIPNLARSGQTSAMSSVRFCKIEQSTAKRVQK